MADIPMVALRAFVHEGQSIAAGEHRAWPAVTAAVLRYQRKADFLPRTVTPPPPARSRRAYKRRDLEAES